jgi:hypothetical protein
MAGIMPAVFLRIGCRCDCISGRRRFRAPGQSKTLPGLRRLLLFGLLGLLRLFRLLRFLSHSILSGFNGLKRDTRYVRRRASLTKSSTSIPADSQAPAPCCHAAVTALSTDVMRFDELLAKNCRDACFAPSSFSGPKAVSRPSTGDDKRAFGRRTRGKDVADFGIDALRRCHLHQFKTTTPIPRRC